MTDLAEIASLEAGSRFPPDNRGRRPARRRDWRLTGRGWAVLSVVALGWSVTSFVAGREGVLNPAGVPQFVDFWRHAAHPDLSPELLRATWEATLTTLAFAVLGTGLSVAAGLLLAVPLSRTGWASSTGSPRSRVLGQGGLVLSRLTAGLPRGVHEAVWGLLLLTVLGRDPLVGVLAIAIPFGAITAKVYSELLDEADHRGYDALRAAGAGRAVSLFYGILPVTAPSLVSYAFYRFECSIRSAVILGMIGAGGLGLQLSLSFQGLQYDEMWTSIYALVALGALVDRWGAALRGRTKRGRAQADQPLRWQGSAALGGILTVASVWHLSPDVSRWFSSQTLTRLGGLVDAMVPLRLPAGGWSELVSRSVETVQMSVLAVAVASVLGVLVALVAARGDRSGWRWAVGGAARLLLLVTRAIPPPVWALLVLFVVFPGPLPGALALGIYTFGILGRLFAEVVEELDHRPGEALTGLGAGAVQSFAYASLPAAAGQLTAYSLYRWEVTARETVVVGVVGAGGLGRLLEEQRAAFDYAAMTSTVLALVAVSLLVDAVSHAVRRSLG